MGALIGVASHGVACMGTAPDAMLGPVEGHELHVGRIVEDVNVRHKVTVYARGVGDKSHALAFQQFEAVGPEHFDACLDALGKAGRGHEA